MGDKRETYPEIALNDEERRREPLLRGLGSAYQQEMTAQGNPCALKGGTAMRLSLGLPRPSTDLDFEGDKAVSVRKTVQRAAAAAFPNQKCSVGWDWLKRGTVRVTIHDNQTGAGIRTSLDYRQAGSRESIPARIDLSKCKRLHGMNVYENRDLVERKLNTVVGSTARQKPRDLYDAGWLVHEHPELISQRQAAGLKAWLADLSAEKKKSLKQEMRDEQVIGRADVDKAWTMLEDGIRRLSVERDDGGNRGSGSKAPRTNPTGPPPGLGGTRTGESPATRPQHHSAADAPAPPARPGPAAQPTSSREQQRGPAR